MTTIAFANGLLAVDSQVTDGGFHRNTAHRRKLIVEEGRVFAIAGGLATAEQFVREEARDVPFELRRVCELADGDAVVELKNDGTLRLYQGAGYMDVPRDDRLTIGSGAAAAEALLCAGLSPGEALHYVAMVDVYTGGPILCAIFTSSGGLHTWTWEPK